MELIHNGTPYDKMIALVIANLFGSIISHPYASRIIRCVAGKYEVLIVCCSTGFTGNRHIVFLESRQSAGASAGNYIFHHIGKKEGGSFFNNTFSLIIIFKKYISIMVKNLCVWCRLHVDAAVCDCAICGCQLKHRYTVCKSAQWCISVYIIFCYLLKTKVQQIIICVIYSGINYNLCSQNVHWVPDTFSNGSVASVAWTPPVAGGPASYCKRLVLYKWTGWVYILVNRRSIGSQNLKAWAWLTVGLRSPVKYKVAALCSASTDNCLDISCFVIKNDHCRLKWIWNGEIVKHHCMCIINILGLHFLSKRFSLIFVGHCFGLCMMLLLISLFIEHRNSIGSIVGPIRRREQGIVIKYILKPSLYILAHCWVNLQTAAVYQIISFLLIKVSLLLKVISKRNNKMVDKIVMKRYRFFIACLFSYQIGVNILSYGTVIFRLSYISKIKHFIKHSSLSFLIGFRVAYRRIFWRVFSYPC